MKGINMKLWITTVLIALMTVINVGTLVLNTSHTAQAAVAGMSWVDLQFDFVFKKAVSYVAEKNCGVDYGGSIAC